MLGNKDSLIFWKNLANNNPVEKSTKLGINDFSLMDAKFILKYTNESSSILDLASGSGLTINKYCKKVSHITAIEKFQSFSKFIQKTEKIDIINEDIASFDSQKKYDIVTMFGIVSYFNMAEIIVIYSKYRNFLKPSGKLIIKNQFGVKEDVEVSGYSEEQKNNYFAQYRHIDNEVKILSDVGYRNIEVFDIYPPECNRWENTHFYAIVADV